MEYVGVILLFSIIMGLLARLSAGWKRGKRKGLGTPALFVHLTGRRLRITTRSE
jgi:hypothetical protein